MGNREQSPKLSRTTEDLREAIAQARDQYFRLALLVGPSGSGKTGIMRALARDAGCSLVNVNLELSQRMLGLSATQRVRQADRLLKEILAAIPGEVVLLDNLEILFDRGLAIQPLRQLQVLSRNRTVVASWNGQCTAGSLTYAEPGHPEYARFQPVDAIVVTLDEAVR